MPYYYFLFFLAWTNTLPGFLRELALFSYLQVHAMRFITFICFKAFIIHSLFFVYNLFWCLKIELQLSPTYIC